MAKKRPTAEDRDLADIFRKMAIGKKYKIEVTPATEVPFMALAELKVEGSTVIDFGNRKIRIVPT